MKPLKANNYNQAVKELSNLDKRQAKKLKDVIDHKNRKYYHVIAVTIIPNPGEAKNTIKTNIHKLHPRSFEKFEKNHGLVNVNRIIILHDPTLLEEEEVKILPKHEKESIEAKIRREMKVQHDAELSEKIAKGVAKALEKKENESENEIDDNDVQWLKDYNEAIEKDLKADLLGFADKYKIDMTGAKDNVERTAKIDAWKEAKENS